MQKDDCFRIPHFLSLLTNCIKYLPNFCIVYIAGFPDSIDNEASHESTQVPRDGWKAGYGAILKYRQS